MVSKYSNVHAIYASHWNAKFSEGQTTVQYNFSYPGSMGQEEGGGVHNVEMSITENMYIVYSHVPTHFNTIN